MLQKVTVGRWSLDAYDGVAPEEIMQELREHAHALQGARILNVNATSYGGGVSELLRSSVPLLRDLGLTVDWKVIGGDEDFFHATKALHNALQGAPRSLTEAEQAAYMRCLQENAATLDGGYDFIIVHDPQPAGLLQAHGKGRCALGVALPHRHQRTQPRRLELPGAAARRVRRGGVHDGRVRAARLSGERGSRRSHPRSIP